jgi:predicted nucleic acid-binding protein
MEPLFLDTNILIRYLTQDDPAKAAGARALLKQVEAGQLTLVTSESIVVEAVQVLSSKVLYNQPRPKVATDLTTILSLPKLKLPNKRVCLRALALWVNASASVDFVDALSVAQMEHQGIATIASFDEDFDRFPQIKRQAPAALSSELD